MFPLRNDVSEINDMLANETTVTRLRNYCERDVCITTWRVNDKSVF